MSDRIEVPEANLRNIAIFAEEPNEALVEEIKQHVRLTAAPHTWRGHSHTKPATGALIYYVEEFDVPALDAVARVAPCPCCSPHHAKYKNKGKIGWFPDEKVIRLIGPQCFAAINATGHAEAIIDLRIRQKRRAELETIARHLATLGPLIDVLTETSAILEDLDEFQRDINRVLDNDLQLNLWREAKGGDLTTSETRQVPYRKPDGSIGQRSEEHRVPFARIAGHSMIDRSGQLSSGRLGPLRAGLTSIAKRLEEAGTPDVLTDAEREAIATALVKGRAAAQEVLDSIRDRQSFLTSGAIQELDRWGQHPNAPIRFSIAFRRSEVVISAFVRSRGTITASVFVGGNATLPIPAIPSPMD